MALFDLGIVHRKNPTVRFGLQRSNLFIPLGYYTGSVDKPGQGVFSILSKGSKE